jgi:hypothetical protein
VNAVVKDMTSIIGLQTQTRIARVGVRMKITNYGLSISWGFLAENLIARPGRVVTSTAVPLDADGRLAGHHRPHAVRAHLLEMAGDRQAAVESYLAAAHRTTSIPERAARLGE